MTLCRCKRTIHKRNEEGKMGRECLDCGNWEPVGFERSAMAVMIDIMHRKALALRSARETES